jgi:hypothetical protein
MSKPGTKRKTLADEAIETLTSEQLLVLTRAYDLPSLEVDPKGFKRKLQNMMHSWRFRKGGLTPQEVTRMLVVQGERCFICQRLKSQLRVRMQERWDIDHDKGSPPRVRGILCSMCNRWLGYLEKSHPGILEDALKRAAEYVNTPPAQTAGVDRNVTFDPDRPRIELSQNQLNTARHFASEGLSVREIAKKLNVRPHTIEAYKRRGIL